MRTTEIEIKGTSPLLMHNIRLANPFDKYTKELKLWTGKKKKTEDDLLEIARIEWEGGMYWSDTHGPVMPGRCIKACILRGATKTKEGPSVRSGLVIAEDECKLEYDGPRTIDAMWQDGRFSDMRMIGVGKSRTLRTRPAFSEWGLRFGVSYEENIVELGSIHRFVQTAGQMVGIGDFRPEKDGDFGRFMMVTP